MPVDADSVPDFVQESMVDTSPSDWHIDDSACDVACIAPTPPLSGGNRENVAGDLKNLKRGFPDYRDNAAR